MIRPPCHAMPSAARQPALPEPGGRGTELAQRIRVASDPVVREKAPVSREIRWHNIAGLLRTWRMRPVLRFDSARNLSDGQAVSPRTTSGASRPGEGNFLRGSSTVTPRSCHAAATRAKGPEQPGGDPDPVGLGRMAGGLPGQRPVGSAGRDGRCSSQELGRSARKARPTGRRFRPGGLRHAIAARI